ncbi:SusC/RagA family TonB-linked outer membrane protein [Flavobacterium sp. xlx-214]|uniref:SusC/RagA family TonB-linked outer membrane protein n=1 Tax=unclassified Flavobacterium TaxID=196869 RepID=UPI0013D2E508|nr:MULTISPECIES: SusC/RagA family TonB-linked outer membrane protein [unclassified Flavobacterium]MBA5793403.1 SusC/RagA family TonB-linked outer membrane protein [Flavobacterium sp. xlx-221]QMI84037.1 SusC/RagA family TonB-linked outer membrane protein [Flavobacterium sp. xlx-214]
MNKKTFVSLTVAVAFCGLTSAYAQEKTITGTVKIGSEVVSGVDVVVNGGEDGTSTDDTGGYSISAKVGDKIEYHYVGYKSETRIVNASTQVMNITLVEDESLLDEIVVLAYGQQRSKNEITGNAVKVSGEEISKVPLASADQALQGRVAGLQMSANSGSPGSTQQIRIRGLNSLSASNDPLIVIDGVPMLNGNLSGNTEASTSLSALSSINSNDIESITVLKDAGATSVYGARGANGVILITTKRGKTGEAKFEVVSSLGFQRNAVKGPRSLTGEEKYQLLLEAYNNTFNGGGGFEEQTIYDQLIARYPAQTAALQDWIDAGRPINNWRDAMSNKDAMVSILNFSATGGDEKSNFYASLGYNKTEGTVIGSDFRRITGMFSYDTKLNKKVDFGFSANVSNVRQQGILEGGAYFSNPNMIKYFMSPWNNIYNADGSPNINGLSGLHNPLYTLANNQNINDIIRVINSNKIKYKIAEDFSFNTQLSIDYTSSRYHNYNNPVHGDGDGIGGYVEDSNMSIFNYISQNSFDYRFFISDDHRFDVKALMEFQKVKTNNLYGYGENIAIGFSELGNTSANHLANSYKNDWMNLAYVGLVNYAYLNKYMIDASLRREGSSRFADSQRWGTFWSVGAAWNIMNEEFLQDSKTLSTLRLRGSYGTTGNSGIAINQYQRMVSTDRYDGIPGFIPSQLSTEIGWETQKKLDVGVDLGFLQDRITAGVAYYKSISENLLYNVPLTQIGGYTGVIQNIGSLENRGWEFELNAQVVKKENFSWTVYGNLGTVENEMIEMQIDPVTNKPKVITGTFTTIEEGHSIRGWKMKKYAGVNPENGNAWWYVNGKDGAKTENYGEAASEWTGKSAMPTYTAGLGTQLDIGNFFVGANLYFSGGNQVYEDWSNYIHGTTSTALLNYNSTEYVLDRWQNPGDVTNTPKLTYGSTTASQPSTRFLKDGDFIRLRDVSIGYNLKGSVLQHLKIDGLSFSLRGTNLYTWTKDKTLKLDPEVGTANDGSYGYVGFTSPPVKSIIFTVNVKF